MPQPILVPLCLLVAWSVFVAFWMMAVRSRAMQIVGLSIEAADRMSDLSDKMPRPVQRVSENYNHLMEQPTVYYALGLALTQMGETSGWVVALAWAYSISRIVHSCVQWYGKNVMARALIFTFGTAILAVLAIRAFILAAHL